MQSPLILDYEIYDEDGPCAPYFTGRITDADGRVMCNAENEERAAELIDYVAALRARVARLEEAGRELLEACEAADIEGDLSEHVSGDMMFNFRRALEEK